MEKVSLPSKNQTNFENLSVMDHIQLFPAADSGSLTMKFMTTVISGDVSDSISCSFPYGRWLDGLEALQIGQLLTYFSTSCLIHGKKTFHRSCSYVWVIPAWV